MRGQSSAWKVPTHHPSGSTGEGWPCFPLLAEIELNRFLHESSQVSNSVHLMVSTTESPAWFLSYRHVCSGWWDKAGDGLKNNNTGKRSSFTYEPTNQSKPSIWFCLLTNCTLCLSIIIHPSLRLFLNPLGLFYWGTRLPGTHPHLLWYLRECQPAQLMVDGEVSCSIRKRTFRGE